MVKKSEKVQTLLEAVAKAAKEIAEKTQRDRADGRRIVVRFGHKRRR